MTVEIVPFMIAMSLGSQLTAFALILFLVFASPGLDVELRIERMVTFFLHGSLFCVAAALGAMFS